MSTYSACRRSQVLPLASIVKMGFGNWESPFPAEPRATARREEAVLSQTDQFPDSVRQLHTSKYAKLESKYAPIKR